MWVEQEKEFQYSGAGFEGFHGIKEESSDNDGDDSEEEIQHRFQFPIRSHPTATSAQQHPGYHALLVEQHQAPGTLAQGNLAPALPTGPVGYLEDHDDLYEDPEDSNALPAQAFTQAPGEESVKESEEDSEEETEEETEQESAEHDSERDADGETDPDYYE